MEAIAKAMDGERKVKRRMKVVHELDRYAGYTEQDVRDAIEVAAEDAAVSVRRLLERHFPVPESQRVTLSQQKGIILDFRLELINALRLGYDRQRDGEDWDEILAKRIDATRLPEPREKESAFGGNASGGA